MDETPDLDLPVDILSDYVSAHLPWLQAHPMVLASVITFGPIILFAVATSVWRRRKPRAANWKIALRRPSRPSG